MLFFSCSVVKMEKVPLLIDYLKKNVSSPWMRTFLPFALNMIFISFSFYTVRAILRGEVKAHKKVLIRGKYIMLNAAECEVAENIIDSSEIDSTFSDVGGLETTKEALIQHVVWPFKHAHHMSQNSIRSPPKGVLLYGPPGSGKTLIARALAKELGCTFINVKADTIFSKWVGETEKHVAAIFSVARSLQPTIIFIDEIDSILSSRNDMDNAVVGHSKALFMIEWDGLKKDSKHKIIVVGATNRRNSIDPAVLRRLPLQFEIGLPDVEARKKILRILLANDFEEGAEKESIVSFVAETTHNYSGADLEELCKAAALLPLQGVACSSEYAELPEITVEHFKLALTRVKGYTPSLF